LLNSHEYTIGLGYNDLKLSEDGMQILAYGKFADIQAAADMQVLIKMGAITTMSVGFMALDYTLHVDDWGVDIKEAEIVEGSIVPVPANPEANIVAVKSMSGLELENKELKLENAELKDRLEQANKIIDTLKLF
jgi:HK97 family phage prohead protease